MRTAGFALVLALAASAAAAEERPFCAERPGKATPPCILDAGRVQLETGLADAVLQSGADTHWARASFASASAAAPRPSWAGRR